MTRETKIGLLVGLAFIIVVGILLSDHMAATTEPIAAPLDQAASTARTAMVSPGENHTTPITRVIAPADISPPAQVPTADEIAARQPVQQIAIGGPAAGGVAQPAPQTHVVAVDPPAAVASVVDVAKQVGEPLVNSKGEELASRTGTTAGQLKQTTETGTTGSGEVVKQTVKTYTVQDGDTLTKIAAKTMGAGTRANVAALIKANPELKENPDLVVVGAEYTIPSSKSATVVTAKPTASNSVAVLPMDPQTPGAPARKSTDASQYAIYTVKEKDTLWHIAQDEVGSSSAVSQIMDLNKDVLKGNANIRAGMRLRLPAKLVASAD